MQECTAFISMRCLLLVAGDTIATNALFCACTQQLQSGGRSDLQAPEKCSQEASISILVSVCLPPVVMEHICYFRNIL